MYQLDVKFAFLNGLLEDMVYVEQPDGFSMKRQEDDVYLLKKDFYYL